MRYLRLFTNALAGGMLGAIYLTLLLLDLNPQVPLVSTTALRWLRTFMAFYGLQLSVGVFLLLLVGELLVARLVRPAWLSVRLLAWLGAAGAATAALVTWANLRGFLAVLDADAALRMRHSAEATTIFAAVLVVVALMRYSFGRRGGPATGVLLVIAVVLSVAVPAWLRGPGEVRVRAVRDVLSLPRPIAPDGTLVAAERPPTVRLILLDGASLGLIRERVAAGGLSNVGRILDRGAAMDLATLRPTQPEPIWAAAATGKYPPTNGIRSNAVYRVRPDDVDPVNLLPDYCFAFALPFLGLVTREDASAASLGARPLWDILADSKIPSGIVRWPLTFPAHTEWGYVISDRFDEGARSPLRWGDARAGSPTSAVEIARGAFDASLAAPGPEGLPAAVSPDAPTAPVAPVRWDRAYSQAAALLEPSFSPRLTAVRYVGIDTMGHTYLRYSEPQAFGGVTAEEVRRFGGVLDGYYRYIDSEVGAAMRQLEPGDLLLVVSGFGMEPEGLGKRLLARLLGRPQYSGTHEAAPDGFLLAYGTNVVPGQILRRGAIVDLAPTVLFYMGVPVGRDMDGFARADLFLTSYTIDHPITYIATHER
jgi:hypothetical protein